MQAQSNLNDAVGAQGSQGASGTGGGPSSGGGDIDDPRFNAQNDPTGCTTDPTGPQCQLCTQDPSHPSCGGGQTPRAQYRENDSTRRTLDEFNTPVPSGGYVPPSYGGNGEPPQAAQARPVPNGGGGGMMGGGGGGSASSQLGQKGGARAASSNNVADILQGEGGRSGWSGYGQGQPTNEFENSGRRWGTQGARGPANARTPYDGMDLKKYLPGKAMDPGRNIGGRGRSPDLYGPGVNMFKRHFQRLKFRCMDERLIGCKNGPFATDSNFGS